MFNDMQSTKQIIANFLNTEMTRITRPKKAENSGQYSRAEISEESIDFLREKLRKTISQIKEMYGITWKN